MYQNENYNHFYHHLCICHMTHKCNVQALCPEHSLCVDLVETIIGPGLVASVDLALLSKSHAQNEWPLLLQLYGLVVALLMKCHLLITYFNSLSKISGNVMAFYLETVLLVTIICGTLLAQAQEVK